jgi:SecY interacting protein Syd
MFLIGLCAAVCNLSGEVIKETLGTRNREVLAENLAEFLNQLQPVL